MSGGVKANDFLSEGEQAYKNKSNEEALSWYRRVQIIEPVSSDLLYFMGLVYQSQGDFLKAAQAFNQAIEIGNPQRVRLSDLYYRLGLTYQAESKIRDLEKALAMYNAALTSDWFSTSEIKADVYYKRGEIYLWQGRDPLSFIAEFRQAIALQPSHRWAHLRLGSAIYQAYHDAKLAETEIIQALLLWPDDANKYLGYQILGDIYRDSGLIDKATAAYREALKLNPDDSATIESLKQLLEEPF